MTSTSAHHAAHRAAISVQRVARCLAPAEASDDTWFEADRLLGKRGHKYLGEGAKYLLAAVTELHSEEVDGDATGMVVATNYGAKDVHLGVMTELRESGLAGISPMWAPNFSTNLVAAYPSIKFGYRAFNLTVTTPWGAGIDALHRAALAINADRATRVVVAATETVSKRQSRRAGAIACIVSKVSARHGPSAIQIDAILRATCWGENIASVTATWQAALQEVVSHVECPAFHVVSQRGSATYVARQLCDTLARGYRANHQTTSTVADEAASLEPLDALLSVDLEASRNILIFVGSCGAAYCVVTSNPRGQR